MANIYVGFHDQRNSSRILKPPGGGTSDIFGTDTLKAKKEEISVPNTPTKETVETNNQNVPEEKSDSNNVDNAKQEENHSNSEEPKIENLSINEDNSKKAPETDQANEKSEAKPDTISSIIRQEDKVQSPVTESEKKTPQRVPPGGYSSGLW